MFNIASIITTAILVILGNILYFEYRFKKENTTEKLTKLLQPLYIILKTDELEYHAYAKSKTVDLYEYYSDMPERLLKPIKKILNNYLYLADDQLQRQSLKFLKWAYSEDSNERYDKLHTQALKQDKTFENFQKIVYKKYDEQREKYLQII